MTQSSSVIPISRSWIQGTDLQRFSQSPMALIKPWKFWMKAKVHGNVLCSDRQARDSPLLPIETMGPITCWATSWAMYLIVRFWHTVPCRMVQRGLLSFHPFSEFVMSLVTYVDRFGVWVSTHPSWEVRWSFVEHLLHFCCVLGFCLCQTYPSLEVWATLWCQLVS